MQKISAVLFDFDGTLVDSVEIYLKIFAECLAEQGVEPARFGDLHEVMTLPLPVIFERLAPVVNVRQFEKSYVAKELALNETKHLPLISDVPDTLEFLQRQKIKTGIVSSKATQLIHDLLRDYELAHYFDIVVGRDLVARQKPFPDCVWKACELIAAEPKNILFVGDTLLDLTAAKEAGATFVGVLTGVGSHHEFEKNKADYIFSHVGEVANLVRRLAE